MGRGKLLKRLANEVLPPELASAVWNRVELIGDIALIRAPPSIAPEALRPLAERLLQELKYVRSVWVGYPGVSGAYRLRPYVHLAGEPRSEAVYKEHGCLFKVDVTKAYISPSLSYEHLRVAKLVRDGEVVTNMFAGVGPFSIIIARHARPRKVYSIDINPDAYRYMVENVKLNKVQEVVEPILGDAAEVVETRLKGTSDRVLMPYPDIALEYLRYAMDALRDDGGVIHLYLHVRAERGEDPVERAKEAALPRLAGLSRSHEVLFGRVVRMIAPRTYQVVLDIRAIPSKA
ncbi:MAG: class I SAM-dependent methyltransferase family protein [Desulfurococcaceae archaeon]